MKAHPMATAKRYTRPQKREVNPDQTPFDCTAEIERWSKQRQPKSRSEAFTAASMAAELESYLAMRVAALSDFLAELGDGNTLNAFLYAERAEEVWLDDRSPELEPTIANDIIAAVMPVVVAMRSAELAKLQSLLARKAA